MPLADYASPTQYGKQRNDRAPYGGHPAWTLVSTARDYQDFARAADLPLAKPCLGAMSRVSRARQRLPKIQDVAKTKLRFVECFPDRLQRALARPHLHCAGAPAARPNAVVTAIFQPASVFTKTRSDTPLEVVSF